MNSEWWLLAGLACLIVAGLIALGSWALDLFRLTDEEAELKREWYREAIRDEIDCLVAGEVLDSSYLNELLRDYRRVRS